MRLLITQRDLKARGGSELFTTETALAMMERGHDVRVYAPGGGDGVLKLQSFGLKAATTLPEQGWEPEVIHGQHHLQAVTALLRHQSAPMLYFIHGGIPWVEQPPAHGRIRRYAVTCTAMRDGVETYYDIPKEKCFVIGNYVDTARFRAMRDPVAKPARALVFGNHRYPPEQLRLIHEACAETGLHLDMLGAHMGGASLTPETVLPAYDIVFAIGRCAIEAAACGCAVIPVLPGLAGSLVSMENLARLAAANFSPRLYSAESELRKDWLVSQIRRYDPAETARVSTAIRADFTLQQAMDHLESEYGELQAQGGAQPPAQEISDLLAYLQWAGPETDRLWAEAWEVRKAQMALDAVPERERQIAALTSHLDSSRQALEKLKLNKEKIEKKLGQEKKKWRTAEKYLDRSFLGRYWLGKIKRRIGEDGAVPGKGE